MAVVADDGEWIYVDGAREQIYIDSGVRHPIVESRSIWIARVGTEVLARYPFALSVT